MRLILLLSLFMVFTACTQLPAEVVQKSGNFYKSAPMYQSKHSGKAAVVSGNVHIVKKGDNLYRIAVTHQLSPKEVIQLNRLHPPYNLQIGQRIRLPQTSMQASIPKASLPKKVRKSVQVSNPMDYPLPVFKPGTKLQYAAKKQKLNYQKLLPQKGTLRFAWPVKGKVISTFGAKGGGRYNDGINIKTKEGQAVKAAEDGVVVYAGDELKGYGNLVLIKHPKGFLTTYAHNRQIKVKRGQQVRKGHVIGYAGSSGGVKESQLHFAIRKGKKAVNPLKYL